MSSYVVLARKWRPAQFQDIVGQAPIVRTLMNAIRSDRLHQAYLFTGSRGIGKTTIARLFAKTIRCENTKTEGDWLIPCNECSSCLEINESRSVDVLEIDGASNNGVDSVREIRENAKYLPSTGSKKIYIIDEVHMLTTAAFNALLKTLEEPPAHVSFIFATTEPHKIPATILSRVQRFDLRRVTTAQIKERLSFIAENESLKIESAAMSLIARSAEGSMRDALSILDQVISFAGQEISAESVRDSVGLIGNQAVLRTLKSILERNAVQAVNTIQDCYEQGYDLRVFTQSLLEILHAVILSSVGSNVVEGDYSSEEWSEIQSLAGIRELEELEVIFQVFHHGMGSVARSSQPKIVLDLLAIKCASAELLITVADADGASKGRSAGGAASRPSAPKASGVTTQSRAETQNQGPAPKPAQPASIAPSKTAPQEAPSASVSSAPNAPTSSAPAPVSPAPTATAPATPASEMSPAVARALANAGQTALPGDSAAASAPAQTSQAPAQAAAAPAMPAQPAPIQSPAQNAAPAQQDSPAPQAGAPAGKRDWQGFVDFVRSERPLLGSLLEHAECKNSPDVKEHRVLSFHPDHSFKSEQLKTRTYLTQLHSLSDKYFGENLQYEITTDASVGPSLAVQREEARVNRENEFKSKVKNHPVIREAQALFGGELGPIELNTKGQGQAGGGAHVSE